MKEITKAVIQKDGKFLLVKRSNYTEIFPGFWDFPGGGIEPGETPEQTVVREVREETSLEINPGREIKQAIFRKDEREVLVHYFTPAIVSGTLKLSSEHTDYVWVKKEEIKTLNAVPSVGLFFGEEI
ncbi:MAG: NUDIX domain-containing protein [Candidatus Nanoarchaeia archaeon]